MSKAIYPGSFDPITYGHIDIIQRATKTYDELVVLVAGSVHKKAMFSKDERCEMLEEVFQDRKNIKVEQWDGLIVDYAAKNKVPTIIRGLRAASDFEYEFMMAAANKRLNADIETYFMMTGESLFFISSSMVKELVKYDADISMYVPECVKKRILKKRG